MAKKKQGELSVVDEIGEIRKAVEAITISPKSGRLTLLSRKLFNALLRLAQQQGEDKEMHEAKLGDVLANATFDSNDTKLVKEHLRRMVATQVEWTSGQKSGRRWGVTTLIASVEIIENSGGPTLIQWSYAPSIRKRLMTPDMYAKLSLRLMGELRSYAALALYELGCRYVTSPGSLTMRQDWSWWEPILTGVPPDPTKERSYKYFKRDYIMQALKEINTLTDLSMELIEHKVGNKVLQIQFLVTQKIQAGLPLGEPNLFDLSILARMQKLGLSEREAEKVYCEFEETQLRASLDWVEKRMRSTRQSPVLSPAGLLKDALRKGYAETPALPSKAPAARPALHSPEPKPEKPSRETLLAELKAVRRQDAFAKYEALPEKEQLALRQEFLSGAPPSVRGMMQKKGLASAVAREAFLPWLVERYWSGPPSDTDLLEFALSRATR